MELRLGSALRADHNFFWNRIEREILSRVQVLPFDRAAAEWAGDVLSELKRVGKGIGLEDSMIGAIALSHGYAVVTWQQIMVEIDFLQKKNELEEIYDQQDIDNVLHRR